MKSAKVVKRLSGKAKGEGRGSLKTQKREALLCVKCRSEVVSDGDEAPPEAGREVVTLSPSKAEEDKFLEWGDSLSQAYRGVDERSAPKEHGGSGDLFSNCDWIEEFDRMSIPEVASTVLTQNCRCSCHEVHGHAVDYAKAGMSLDVCAQCSCFERW